MSGKNRFTNHFRAAALAAGGLAAAASLTACHEIPTAGAVGVTPTNIATPITTATPTMSASATNTPTPFTTATPTMTMSPVAP